MTYFGFLLRFLVLPSLVLLALIAIARRRGHEVPRSLRSVPVWVAIALHVVVAVVYTTPWDNYLVATGVWWYEPGLVTGLTIGWVPIEEYTFFVLQPILTGLWLWFLLLYLPPRASARPLQTAWRRLPLLAIAALWLASVLVLLAGWQPGTYLALLLGWSLPPIALQVAFGGDILAHYGRLVLAIILPATLYLSIADGLAIDGGTWTINPAQSLHILLAGILPLEEFVFFLVTNTLIAFGSTLLIAAESHQRFAVMRARLRAWRGGPLAGEN